MPGRRSPASTRDGVRPAADGFPTLPLASNGLVSIDSESLVRMPDGSFFIGDEYGPYVYRFSAEGRMLAAIRPPEALIPKRQGRDHFSSNNPGPGAKPPEPRNPESGRANNQGFEGLALTPGGKFLVVILQSATRQDGGSPQNREYTRILYYDIADPDLPRLVREHVVPLPVFTDARGQAAGRRAERTRGARRDALPAALPRFRQRLRHRRRDLALSQGRGARHLGGDEHRGLEVRRHRAGRARRQARSGVVPATLTPFIDLNDNAQLGRFGLHNGMPNDRDNLSEKWEGMALVPALDPANPRDFFLFISNDNDFITQDGYQVGAPYKDKSGVDVDTLLLVYRLTLPDFAK